MGFHRRLASIEMGRVCGNCGNTQGPFDKYWIGPRKTGQWIFTCPDPTDKSPEERQKALAACMARRDKRYAATHKGNTK